MFRFDRVYAEHDARPASWLFRRVPHIARHWLRERAAEAVPCAPALPCPLQPRSGTLRTRNKLRIAHADPPPERCDAFRHSGKPPRARSTAVRRACSSPCAMWPPVTPCVRRRADSRRSSSRRPVPPGPRHRRRRVRRPVWRTTCAYTCDYAKLPIAPGARPRSSALPAAALGSGSDQQWGRREGADAAAPWPTAPYHPRECPAHRGRAAAPFCR